MEGSFLMMARKVKLATVDLRSIRASYGQLQQALAGCGLLQPPLAGLACC